MMSKVFLLLAVAPILMGAEPARTVILVRHAERAGGMAPEVGLSEAGRCRAQLLSGMLTDAGISQVFTSDVARTQQTAEPIAKKLGVKPEAIAGKDYDAWISKLNGAKGVSLVVGHSDTVPEIISRLGAGKVTPIPDTDFDRLFVVTISGGLASVVMLHYAGCAK